MGKAERYAARIGASERRQKRARSDRSGRAGGRRIPDAVRFFSTENWNRPPAEVTALIGLLVETIKGEIKDLNKNGVRLVAIGDIEALLPAPTYKALIDGIEQTKNDDRICLVLALNYSAKWEILRAARQLAAQAASGALDPASIDESVFESALSTHGIPDPELLIRTSGETRISNFLLWQIAYADSILRLSFGPIWPKGTL